MKSLMCSFLTAEAQRRSVIDNQFVRTLRLCASAVKNYTTYETPHD
jgi:transcriptional regulator NrdR family protein